MLNAVGHLDPAGRYQLRGQHLTEPAGLEQCRVRVGEDVRFRLGPIQHEPGFMVEQEPKFGDRRANSLIRSSTPSPDYNRGSTEHSSHTYYQAEGTFGMNNPVAAHAVAERLEQAKPSACSFTSSAWWTATIMLSG
jgi:hypothetical protein